MKRFFSYIDASLDCPQSLQHLAVNAYSNARGGAVVFYGSEDALTLEKQLLLNSKIERMTEIDGICFFSFHQFRRGPEVDWELLKKIMAKGWEAHFARERFSICSVQDLFDRYLFIESVDYTLRNSVRPVWRAHVEAFFEAGV